MKWRHYFGWHDIPLLINVAAVMLMTGWSITDWQLWTFAMTSGLYGGVTAWESARNERNTTP